VNIGGAVVRRLLAESEALVFNLNTCGYASDLTSLEQVLAELGLPGLPRPSGVDLSDAAATADAASMPDVDHEDDQLLIADPAVCAVWPDAHHIWCAAATRSAQFRQHPHPLAAQRGPGDSPLSRQAQQPEPAPGPPTAPHSQAPPIPTRAAAPRPSP
jgi:hypothetical protein